MKTVNTVERKSAVRKKKQGLSETIGQILREVFMASICGAVREEESDILS